MGSHHFNLDCRLPQDQLNLLLIATAKYRVLPPRGMDDFKCVRWAHEKHGWSKCNGRWFIYYQAYRIYDWVG